MSEFLEGVVLGWASTFLATVLGALAWSASFRAIIRKTLREDGVTPAELAENYNRLGISRPPLWGGRWTAEDVQDAIGGRR